MLYARTCEYILFGFKLKEFYEMQLMLIVLVVQSAASDCPGFEALVALDPGTPYFFDPPEISNR
jgi:hypothetical protein